MATTQFQIKNRFTRQFLTFAGVSSKDFLLYLSGPGVYNSPAPDITATSIPGVNGDLMQDNAASGLRRYNNVDITYEAFFFNGLPAKTAAVKSWLLSPVGYQKLQDTYDPEFFRMGICTSAIEFEVTRQKAASMSLTFNCKPQRWSVAGQETLILTTSGATLYNPYQFPAQPIIRVYGTGTGSVTVNGTTVDILSFADDGYIDLNCGTMNAYNSSGFCNTLIYAEDFPVLTAGENTVTWDGAITAVEITPRWWTL